MNSCHGDGRRDEATERGSYRPLGRFAAIAMTILLAVSRPAQGSEIPFADRASDTRFLSPPTRAMQEDEAANPGMFAVLDGEALWVRPAGPRARSCVGCHGEAAASMRGVAARYPAWSEALGGPVDLAGRIDFCRTAQQGSEPLGRDSPELLALTAFVARQSRGLPIAPPADSRLDATRARGRALFSRRMGQLDLACAQCHDDHWGGHLAGATIPQAHPVGYPEYRLEWQAVGSLQRRMRGCLTGVRAEPFPEGAPEYVELELHLMQRAAGLAMETPAVRP